MDAIFASKLYKSSTRKDKIKAALADSSNAGLVQQLRSYLDPQYQTKDFLEPEDDIEEPVEERVEDEEFSEEDRAENSGAGESMLRPSGAVGAHPHVSPSSKPDDMGEGPESGEEPPEEPPVESSTIIASQCIEQLDIEAIVASLRGNENTTGLDRYRVKENELWLYYNDSVNLNDVMNPVIDLLNSANYSYLEFNRLARSDNAIVFEILDVPVDLKPSTEKSEEIGGVEFVEEK